MIAGSATRPGLPTGRARSGDPVDDGNYPCERRCIAFLCARDGIAGAREYCERTVRTYRRSVLTSRKRGHVHAHFASLPEYRRQFIASYLDFKRFALTHGQLSPADQSNDGAERAGARQAQA
jgi:hypothetical protein